MERSPGNLLSVVFFSLVAVLVLVVVAFAIESGAVMMGGRRNP